MSALAVCHGTNPDLSGWSGHEPTERAMSDNFEPRTSERDPSHPSNLEKALDDGTTDEVLCVRP
jgi:hypothetical protein